MRCHRGEHGCAGVDGLLHRCRDVGDVDGGISKSTGAAPSVAIGVVGCLGRHERITADRARQLGILSEVVEPEQLQARAQDIAETIARHPLDQLRQLKRQLWAALELA